MANLQLLRSDWTLEEIINVLNNNWRTQINERGLNAQNYGQQSVTGGDDVTSVLAMETIKTANIGDLQVSTAKIALAAIVEALIQDLAVTHAKIAEAAIEEANIKDAAITTAKIADANITTAKIALASIVEALIADLAVTNAKIANGTIENAKIKDGTIENAKIKDATIEVAKMASAIIQHLAAGDILTSELTIKNAEGTVVFNSNGITGDGIPNGTITYAQLSDYLQNAIDFIAAGKAVYYQPLEPTGGTYAEGDLWFDTDAAYAAYEWSGTAWVARTANSAAYYVTYMMASLLNAGIITADHINAVTMIGTKIYFGNSSGAHGELYATGGVTYFDMYDASLVKRSSWTFNGMDFFNADGTLSTRIATTTEDKTITVGTGKDYATVQAAINSLPYLINHTITVQIDSGTYSENVLIKNRTGGGRLNISGASLETVNITSIYVIGCSKSLDIRIFEINLTNTVADALIISRSAAYLSDLAATGATAYYHGFDFIESEVYCLRCEASNKSSGFYADRNSQVSFGTGISGSGNTYGVTSNKSIVRGDLGTLTGTTPATALGGGAIIPSTGQGFWQAWTPTLTWSTATPVIYQAYYRYCVVGSTVMFRVSIVMTDGNGATNLTISLPIAPRDTGGYTALEGSQQVSGVVTAPTPGITMSENKIHFDNFKTITDGSSGLILVSGFYEI